MLQCSLRDHVEDEAVEGPSRISVSWGDTVV